MKHVCILCESWESGGIEAFLWNVLSHMDRSELEIDLVAAQLGESIFTQPLQELGVRFYQLSGSSRKILQNQKIFQKLLVERHYDVLHLNAYQGLSLVYLKLAQEMGVPICIAHSHNTALRASLTKPIKLAIHNWAKIKYTKEATALWACAKPAAEFLFPKKELDKRRYIFIPNGIDTERFRFNPEMRNIIRTKLQLEGKLVIGNVGRLCFQKNQEFLLEIFREVLESKPESVLLLIGDGKDKEKLKRKATKLGICNKVVFYGATNQIDQLYWAMDIFVFPSQFEGFGIVAVEAQAAGLPVLCSEAVPLEAIITDQVTQLNLSAGAKKWSEKLLKMNFAERISSSTKVAEAGFDIQAVAERIEAKWRDEAFEASENIRHRPDI
jgi:glycosyltransferase involved in cell wall biosynthesis